MDTQSIKEIQESLRLLSFYDSRLFPLAVDGIYGQQTSDAVRIFQTLNDLNPTGEVDRDTWEQLRDSANEKRFSKPSPLEIFPHPEYLLKAEDDAITASFIQLILQELSRYYSNIQPVTINGIYDTATQKQIQNIQTLHRLESNGNVDIETWNVLSTLFNNRLDSTGR